MLGKLRRLVAPTFEESIIRRDGRHRPVLDGCAAKDFSGGLSIDPNPASEYYSERVWVFEDGEARLSDLSEPEHSCQFLAGSLWPEQEEWMLERAAEEFSRCCPHAKVIMAPRVWGESDTAGGVREGYLGGRARWEEDGKPVVVLATQQHDEHEFLSLVRHELFHVIEADLEDHVITEIYASLSHKEDFGQAAYKGHPTLEKWSLYLNSPTERLARAYASWCASLSNGVSVSVDTSTLNAPRLFASIYSGRTAEAILRRDYERGTQSRAPSR